MKYHITSWAWCGEWIKGELDGFRFSAKVFSEGSEFGIDNGRVSKLSIREGDKEIVLYDRGWEVWPKKPRHLEIYHRVMKKLEEEGP